VAPKDTILVTGSSGFIGGWLVETLHLSDSANVRAGIRSWMSAARLGRFPLDIVLCDVMDVEQIAQAMAGVTCVIHCAYGSREVTVQGTKNMLDVARRIGVQRFVHISTTEVYGNPTGEIDETFPLQYTGNSYGDSKIEAEELCWEHYKQGLPVTVIRPSIVYGPFGRTWTIELAGKLQSGRWGILKGCGEGICNLVYVADLVSGILIAACHPSAVGEAFNLRGPETITWNQYFQRFNAVLRLPELQVRDPEEARRRAILMEPVRALGKFGLEHFQGPLKAISQRSRPIKGLLQSVEASIKTTPRSVELSLFNRQAHYVSTKAEKLLGYKPRFDVSSGLKLTVRWLDHVGLVDQSVLGRRQ
jgi:nucleoside-diphosphate-sugar epimerase